MEARKLQALEMVVETVDALVSERGDTGKIWASLLKDTLKRRRPDFSETYYGFRTFGNLLEEAQTRGLFEFGRDEKSGTYVYRGANAQVELQPVETAAPDIEQPAAQEPVAAVDELAAETQGEQPTEVPAGGREPRRRGGRGRKGREGQAANAQDTVPASEEAAVATWPAPTPDLAEAIEPVAGDVAALPAPGAEEEAPAPAKERRRATRTPRKPAARKGASSAANEAADDAAANDATVMQADGASADAGLSTTPVEPVADAAATDGEGESQAAKAARKKSSRPAHKAPSRKPATRAPRRPAKAKTPPENG